ncbi:MAG: hypothetical protein KIT77_25105 [Caldilinea sp.]|nr:hypothetical protein [Caldilineaceae bacterium]MCB9118715.1 hypothetical protein [Caldilineaceae bacterium]MCW5844555.1 hypothetical protein [Caldilinea sp.]
MFGKKNKKSDGVAIAGDYLQRIEQTVKDYKSIKDYQNDTKKMAKDGWYVKMQTNRHDTGVGVLFGVKHEVIVVTYERVVRSKK